MVPDVHTMTLAEAEKALDEAGLRPRVIDSVFQEQFPGRTIIKQYPTPYSRVKPNRTPGLIFLDIFLITFTPKTIVLNYRDDGWYTVHRIRRRPPLKEVDQAEPNRSTTL